MSHKPLLRYALLALAFVLGLAVLLISVMPVNRVLIGTRPAGGSSTMLIERAAFLHVAAHIVLFGILACVTWFALDLIGAGAINKMIGLAVIMLLGCGTEYLQHRLYDNTLEIYDVLTNVISAAMIFGLLSVWSRYRKRAPEPVPEGEHIAYVLRDIE